ncbi:MAG: iron ABC transporter permease, partial [Mangrovimonas sp.]|nr:iron ABC transporter permease [Mangrovimonas sp.]
MPKSKSYTLWFLILGLVLVGVFLANISLGSVVIPTKEVFKSLIGTIDNESWHYIIHNYRL